MWGHVANSSIGNSGDNAKQSSAPFTSSKLTYSIFQNMNEGLVITNTYGNILNVNQAFCTITGYSAPELLGKNLNVIKSNLHDQTFYEQLWNRITTVGNWKGEIWNRHKNGRLYLQKLSIIAIRDEDDKIINYIGVATDISEEEKLRKDIIRTGILQRTLLPSTLNLQMIEIDTVFTPLKYLGGDFFDYYWDSEKSVLSGYIIDIMGHGVTAAFQNSVLRVLFQQNFDNRSTLVDVLSNINRESMNYFLEDTFAAALCFRVDMRNGLLTYACAGINKFIKMPINGQISIIKQAGPYLGIFEEPIFTEKTIAIETGESFYFMTDGFMDLFEIENPFQSIDLKKNINSLREISTYHLRDDASAIGIFLKHVGGWAK